MLFLFPCEGPVNGAAGIGFYGELDVNEGAVYFISGEVAGNGILCAAEYLPLAFGEGIADGGIYRGEMRRPCCDDEAGAGIAEPIDAYLVVRDLSEADIAGEGGQVKVLIIVNGIVEGIIAHKQIGRVVAGGIIGLAGEIPVVVNGSGVVAVGPRYTCIIDRGRVFPFFAGQATDYDKQDKRYGNT